MSIPQWINLQLGADNTYLRTQCTDIQKINDEVVAIAELLIDRMYKYDGVWLSWPQIWYCKNIFAFTEWDENKKKIRREHHIIINPRITKKSTGMNIWEEWCLSLPNVYGNVARNDWIKMTYYTIDKIKKSKTFTWFNARIIQHEFDHIQGILFIDKQEL